MTYPAPYVHIYAADPQPATRWELDIGEGRKPIVVENEPDALLQCSACYRRIPARDMVAHVYYDGTNYYCREKEYGRSSDFPFEYTTVCKGTAFKGRRREYREP